LHCIAAVIAPNVLIPILVPTDSGRLRPVDKINGNLITPRTSPTIPPIKLMIKPIEDRKNILTISNSILKHDNMKNI
jgi:hypothetical protein